MLVAILLDNTAQNVIQADSVLTWMDVQVVVTINS